MEQVRHIAWQMCTDRQTDRQTQIMHTLYVCVWLLAGCMYV